MFSCERATELMSTSLDSGLSVYQRFVLKIHLFMCKFCSRCWHQMLFLRSAMHKCSEQTAAIDFMPEHSLSEEACKRMQKSLTELDIH